MVRLVRVRILLTLGHRLWVIGMCIAVGCETGAALADEAAVLVTVEGLAGRPVEPIGEPYAGTARKCTVLTPARPGLPRM